MAQITESLCRAILNDSGFTVNEVKRLAHAWLASQAAPCEECGQPVHPGPGAHVRVDAETGEHLPCFGESKAQASPSVPAVAGQEPAEYQRRMRPTWRADGEGWTEWESCSKGSYDDVLRLKIYKDWQYEARALYATPSAPSVSDAKDAERYRHITGVMGLRFKPSYSRCLQSLEETNTAIDAAIAAQAKGASHE